MERSAHPDSLVQVIRALNYQTYEEITIQPRFEKVAIYAQDSMDPLPLQTPQNSDVHPTKTP